MKLAIIVASVREGRLGERVAKWATSTLTKDNTPFELLDLKDYVMPLVDSAEQPFDLNKKYPHEIVQAWSDKIDAADAYIIITPEYNHGYPASIKNALDWLGMEWWGKPIAFIGYSNGLLGGSRSVEQLRQVVAGFNMYGLRNAITIGKAQDVLSEDGVSSVPALNEQLIKMATELDKIHTDFTRI